MTIRELAKNLIEHADEEPSEIDLDRATEIIGWLDPNIGLPDNLTPEAFMATWNDLIKECPKENMKEEVKMKVQFEAGTTADGRGINYLICLEDRDLYAEIEVPEGASEDFGYLVLKQEIIAKAAEKGIEDLEFWYDGQEDKLAPDADGIVR